MNLLQITLVMMATLIVATWIGHLPGKIEKLKKEKKQILESTQKRKDVFQGLNEKIEKEDYIDLYTKLKDKEKIYITSNGTVLNSKPHTFKDFIDNQKLPSKSELIWEILSDNNITIKDIIREIEDDGPFSPDTENYWLPETLNLTSKQARLISIIINFSDDRPFLIDNNYPLYIIFKGINVFTRKLYIHYQAGYVDNNHTRADGFSRTTKC